MDFGLESKMNRQMMGMSIGAAPMPILNGLGNGNSSVIVESDTNKSSSVVGFGSPSSSSSSPPLSDSPTCEQQQQVKLAAAMVTKQQSCTSCKRGEQASSFCHNCNGNICPNCTMAHAYMYCFEGHRVDSLPLTARTSEVMSSSVSSTASNSENLARRALLPPTDTLCYCPQHPKRPLYLFCKSCNYAICCECTLVDHCEPNHQYNPLWEFVRLDEIFIQDARDCLSEKPPNVFLCGDFLWETAVSCLQTFYRRLGVKLSSNSDMRYCTKFASLFIADETVQMDLIIGYESADTGKHARTLYGYDVFDYMDMTSNVEEFRKAMKSIDTIQLLDTLENLTTCDDNIPFVADLLANLDFLDTSRRALAFSTFGHISHSYDAKTKIENLMTECAREILREFGEAIICDSEELRIYHLQIAAMSFENGDDEIASRWFRELGYEHTFISSIIKNVKSPIIELRSAVFKFLLVVMEYPTIWRKFMRFSWFKNWLMNEESETEAETIELKEQLRRGMIGKNGIF